MIEGGFWFKINNNCEVKFDYFDREYNSTRTNERRVEMPIAMFWKDNIDQSKLIEIGCVLPHYEKTTHPVIDLYESFPGVLNIEAKNYDYTGKNVLCISTIEHVEHDLNYISKTGRDVDAAPKLLDRIYNECNKCFFTWPSGVHTVLDRFILSKFDEWKVYLFLRKDEQNNWIQVFDKTLISKTAYANPFPSGNLLIVVEK